MDISDCSEITNKKTKDVKMERGNNWDISKSPMYMPWGFQKALGMHMGLVASICVYIFFAEMGRNKLDFGMMGYVIFLTAFFTIRALYSLWYERKERSELSAVLHILVILGIGLMFYAENAEYQKIPREFWFITLNLNAALILGCMAISMYFGGHYNRKTFWLLCASFALFAVLNTHYKIKFGYSGDGFVIDLFWNTIKLFFLAFFSVFWYWLIALSTINKYVYALLGFSMALISTNRTSSAPQRDRASEQWDEFHRNEYRKQIEREKYFDQHGKYPKD
jgi:hypothetical protein